MFSRLSQLQDAGAMTDEQASLAKAFCTVKAREINTLIVGRAITGLSAFV